MSTPGTSTELEIEQEIDTQPIGPSTRKQQKGWMHLSESDGKMQRGPSCEKFYEREKKLQRLRSLDLHLHGELHEQGQRLSDEELSEIDRRTPHRWKPQTRKIGMVKGAIEARDPYETPQWKRHVNGYLRNSKGLFFRPEWG